MGFSFFNLPKPRGFHYEPRFYKPEEESDQDGREPTSHERLSREIKYSWHTDRTASRKRSSLISFLVIGGLIVILLVFINSKSFVRMFELLSNRPATATDVEGPGYWVVVDSSGKRDTVYKGDEIGGIFSRRIDSLAILGFHGDLGDEEQMRKELGDQYEIVKMRMDQLQENYEKSIESDE